MALLQRTRLLPNERLDLPDYNRIEDFVCADMKAVAKQTLSDGNFIFEGFVATGVGTNTLSITLAGSSLVMGANDGAVFIGAPSLAAIATTSLTPSATNYVEVFLDQDTGGADSRAFWDQTAAGGAGAEFAQIIDTFTFLRANLAISITNFSGASDRAKICEVDVNGSGVITAIRDRRDLFYRLGRGTNPTFSFPWTSRTEPSNTSFNGADKDIKNQKQLDDAFADSIREIKGTTYWFEASPISLTGSFRNTALSMITAATPSASFAWDGSALSITDSNGSPLDSDVLAYIRLFDVSSILSLTRQDSSGGSSTIPIAADEVLWVQLPDPLANVSYDSVGATSTNYRVSARGSVPLNQDTFWLAFREGTKLYVRGIGELDVNESSEISDNVPSTLLTNLGLVGEVSPASYSSNIRGVANESLVSRIGVNTDSIGDEQEDRSAFLRSDSAVTWTGTQLQFSSDLILDILNTKSGTRTTHTILAANSPISLVNNESLYVAISRTATSENVSPVKTTVTPIPAQSQVNKDVIIIASRKDDTDAKLYLPLLKSTVSPSQTFRIGALAETVTQAIRGGTGQSLFAVGDILYADTTTTLAKLPISSTVGSVLKSTGTIPTWGSGASSLAVTIQTSNYLATSTDDVILGDASGGAFNVTLPAASTVAGKVFYIKKKDYTTNAVTVVPNGVDTIDGESTIVLDAPFDSITIVSDGSVWYIL